jgi:hypothetical protein
VNQLRKLRKKQVKSPDSTQLYTAHIILERLSVGFWLSILLLADLDRMYADWEESDVERSWQSSFSSFIQNHEAM